ncbi:MAG: glycosyltransferase family 4 protein [Rhodobacteraceae bacterium]|nr:glycosyltransferase family 4 protein [Paracoccaceae bacterium]
MKEIDAAKNGSPLSILQIGTQFELGGIPRHMIDLSQSLRDQGHSVTLAGTPGKWYGPENDPDFLELPIRYVASEGGRLPVRLGHLATSVRRLRMWLRRNPVDLIHTHESAPALVSMLARPSRPVPVVVTYHGSEPQRIGTFSKIARHCDLVITPSHASARDLATIGGIPEERLKVVGLGVVTPPEDPPSDIARLRQDLIGDGERLIVTVGRLAHQKGIDILIECVARMRDIHPGYRFVVVGDGSLENEYKDLARTKGVLDRLHFAGRTERVHRYLRAADLFLLTSRYEALPYVIVEAFQAGTPAVATACSGVVELIDDSVGRLAPIGDVEAICSAVAALLSDTARLEQMGRAALARSREDRFDPNYICSQFEATYRAITALRR